MRDAAARRLRLAQGNGGAGWAYSRRSVAGRGTRRRCREWRDDDHAADATVRTLVHVEVGYAQPEGHDRKANPRTTMSASICRRNGLMTISCVSLGNIPKSSLTQDHLRLRLRNRSAALAINHYRPWRKNADRRTTPTTA
jgi:hypothetical protein